MSDKSPFPKDFKKVVSRLHGEERSGDDEMAPADGLTWDEVLPLSEKHRQSRDARRLDPDPVSILLAALGALGSVASLAAYVEYKRDKTERRAKARRTAVRAVGTLREALGDVERALDDLERLLGNYDQASHAMVLDRPAEFGAAPPLFDFFQFSVYQMIGQRVTRAFDRCVADTYELMDCIEDGAIQVPSETFAELGELQARLNDLRFKRRTLRETLSGTRHVSQRMYQIIDEFERFIIFDRAS